MKEEPMTLPGTDPRAAGRQAGPEPSRPGEDRRGLGAGWLLLLAPAAWCGGPFIVAGLAAARAATLGAVGGIAAAVVVAAVLVWWIRRRRRLGSCCPPGQSAGMPGERW
jgi:hypothetical protein